MRGASLTFELVSSSEIDWIVELIVDTAYNQSLIAFVISIAVNRRLKESWISIKVDGRA